jgi:ABC-type sugar transport system ATPase subunit
MSGSRLMELRRISKSYGSQQVLLGFNLQVREGERLAILGPNGSGKTTLLRIMGLLDPPDSGEIFFRGERVTPKLAPSLRGRITLVFQENVWISSTVRENLSLGLNFRGVGGEEIRLRTLEVAGRLGLQTLLEKRMWQLSGGEQKRVCIARALMLEPELLLLDEPTAWLDRKNSSLIEEALKKAGGTVVFSTTDPEQAKRLADRVVRLGAT